MTPLQISHAIVTIHTGDSYNQNMPICLADLVDTLVDVAQDNPFTFGNKTREIKRMERDVIEEELTQLGLPISVIRGVL